MIGVNPITENINLINNNPTKENTLECLKKAGQIHKQVRKDMQPILKEGLSLLDLAKFIEQQTLKYGGSIGFPPGLSLNNCAAHFTPDSKRNPVLKYDDILKIDFGVHVDGWIVDSAFTIYFDPEYDKLAEAVRETTYTGIKNAGIDQDIREWGKLNQEVMESYEVTIKGKTYPVKAIRNLGGHNILNGVIHGGTFLPSVEMSLSNQKFKEGVWAIETFGSTGKNTVHDANYSTIYRINPNYKDTSNLRLDSLKKIYNKIENTYSTIPFCQRYVEDWSFKSINVLLDTLVDKSLLLTYPPLLTNPGDLTAQYEHTIYLYENKKEVISKGQDY